MTLRKSASSQDRNRTDPRETLTALKIDFLSSCDRPAQEDALAVLMKRAHLEDGDPKKRRKRTRKADEPQIVVRKNGVPGILVSEENGHQHLVWLDGQAGTTSWEVSTDSEMTHDHSWVLDAMGGITIGVNEDHTHEVPGDSIARALFMIQKNQGDAPAEETDMTPEEKKRFDDLEKRLKKSEEATAASEERTVLQAVLSGMTDSHRSHFDGLGDVAKPLFAAKSVADRDAELLAIRKRAEEADPIVYTTEDGLAIRKSEGTTVLALARKLDARETENVELRKEATDGRLRKQAEDTLSSMPGTTDEHVEMLRGIEAIPAGPARDAAMKALTAGNDALAKGMDTFGTNPAELEATREGSPTEQVRKMAKALAEKDGIPQAQALKKVMETPEARALYAESRFQQGRERTH